MNFNHSPQGTPSGAKTQDSYSIVTEEFLRLKNRIAGHIRAEGFDPVDDLLQEIACAVFQDTSRIRNPESYIIGVTFNVLNRAIAKKMHDRKHGFQGPLRDLDAAECAAYIADNPFQEEELREQKTYQVSALMGLLEKHLSFEERQILRLFIMEGKSHKQIASGLNISENASAAKKLRAINKLKKLTSQIQ